MLWPLFCGPTYHSESSIVAIDRAVNLFPEKVEVAGAKSPLALYGTPGTVRFVTLAGGPIRALAEGFEPTPGNEWLFALAGPNLYKVSPTGTATLMGVVATEQLPGQIIPINGNLLFILSAGQGYTATVTPPAVTPVVLPVGFARSVTFLDNFLFISDVSSNQFFNSNVGDPTTWNAANVATKEASPDILQGVFAAFEQLWIFGLETTEIWYDAGLPGVPVQRYPGGGVIEQGTTSYWSVAKVGDTIMWVGRNNRGEAVVWQARGMNPVRVSNHSVEAAINIETGQGLSQATAWSYEEGGHFFYVLNSAISPLIDITWVYDLSTGQWHERGTWDGTAFHRTPFLFHTMAFFRTVPPTAVGHYVGGGAPTDTSGIIYKQSPALFTYDGAAIKRLRLAPHLSDGLNRSQYDRFHIDLEKIAGAPVMDLRYSDDGGVTFGNTHTVTAQDGQKRMIWRKLGTGRDRVFEVSSLSGVRHAWAAAYLDITPAVPDLPQRNQ